MGFRFSRFSGRAYRCTSYDTPLWASPNRRPGRWSRPSERTCAQYLALDPAAPLAEYLRAERLRDAQIAQEIRISLWELKIDQGAILDLSSPERAQGQGVDWNDLLSDDWTVCQRLAADIQADGGAGVVAPSTALPGSLTLVLFGPRSEIRWDMKPVLSIQVPARCLMTGAPGEGVLRGVRHFGDPYPAEIAPTPLKDSISS
jgi:RES domain-containing protein